MEAPQVGDRLAHFRLVRQLGRGGMGIVYEAEDGKLGRRVALKVLPPEALGAPQSRARFVDEARVAAAIVHPNLVTIYEIGEDAGTVFIAMELVEGETLRKRLAGGALDTLTAIRVTLSLAEALARAHRAGVVHRDLKPDNIMLTPDERAKLLDFGLARLPQHLRERRSDEIALGDTLPSPSPATEEGSIFGTPAYMSPEQARGQRVDGRSDVYSLGATLYELLSGRAPFVGATALDVMASVVRDTPPPLSSVAPAAPSEAERIVDKCMDKDPAHRYQDAAELAVDLRRLLRQLDARPTPTPPSLERTLPDATRGSPDRASPPPSPSTKTSLGGRRLVLAALVTVLLAAGFALWRAWHHGPAPTEHAPVAGASTAPAKDLGPFHAHQVTTFAGGRLLLASGLSPDGKHSLVVRGDQIQIIDLGSGALTSLGRADELALDEWSSDGKWIYGTLHEGHAIYLARVASVGGAPQKLLRASSVTSVVPSPDGKSIAYVAGATLSVANSDGTRARAVRAMDAFFMTHLAWSPDSRWLVVGGSDRISGPRIDLVAAATDATVPLLVDPKLRDRFAAVTFAWTGPDQLLYGTHTNDGTELFEQRVVLSTGSLDGPPVSRGQFPRVEVQLLGATSDGRRVAAMLLESTQAIRVGELPRAGRIVSPRVLVREQRNQNPIAFSDDGKTLYVYSRRGTGGAVMAVPVDGGAPVELLANVFRVQVAGGKLVFLRPPSQKGASELPYLTFDPATRQEAPLGSLPQVAGVVQWLLCPRASLERCVIVAASPSTVRVQRWTPQGGVAGQPLVEAAISSTETRSALSSDGRFLAITDGTHPLRLYDLEHPSALQTIAVPFDAQMLAWTPDGRMIVSGMFDEQAPAHLPYEIRAVGRDGSSTVLTDDERSWLFSPAVSPDGKQLAWGTVEMSANLWLLER